VFLTPHLYLSALRYINELLLAKQHSSILAVQKRPSSILTMPL
jgi:hypothetical protein